MTAAAEAKRHLDVLAAEPRPAGGDGERRAREYCARALSALELTVHEEPFSYSAAPGRYATPAIGGVALLVLAAAAHFGWRGASGVALAILVAGLLAIALMVRAAMAGVLDLPWARSESVNLWAERGIPRVWLVAHLDSKSQPVPIGLRAAGIVALVIATLGALTLAVLAFVAGDWPPAWLGVLALGALGAVPVMMSVVGDRSPGALDNASGVAAVLLTLEKLPRHVPVGVLLTSAEELGLAGAHAWARHRPAGVAVNFDGLDDRGPVRLMYSGTPNWDLLRALDASARRVRTAARAIPVPLGILVDGVALAKRGWKVVTISKGSWQTLTRIHTPGDSLHRLRGDGVAEAAALAAGAVEALS